MKEKPYHREPDLDLALHFFVIFVSFVVRSSCL